MRVFAGLLLAAAASASEEAPAVEARLVARHASARPGGVIEVGLFLTLPPGWHVYWRNPGDGGVAPAISWELPEGVEAEPVRWPVPERIPTGPLMGYGYHGDVLLPVLVRIGKDVSGTVRLRARATWLVCREFCVDGSADLELDVPVLDGEPEHDARWASRFAALSLPRRASYPASASREEDALRLECALLKDAKSAYFFAYDDGMVAYAAPQRLLGGALLLTEPARRRAERLHGVLVVDGEPYEVDAAVEPRKG